MIQASELRLGNLIHLKDKGEYTIDSGHDLDELLSWGDIEYASAIPLTNEWAERLGFKWDILHQAWHKEEFKYNITPNYNDASWRMGDWRFINVVVERIEYVHQLQNLYYALTGNELTCTAK